MAGREIKTTLAVDGEQAFKRSLNDAKTSVRNLGTQLTLAQAEFKKDGDAMKLMETRTKALKGEIDAQKEVVKALEGAVKDSAKQYGEGSKEAEKWEAELNRAKATMASLEAELANNEQGLDRNGKAFDDAGAAASEFSDSVNNISKGISFEMITSGIGSITSGFESAIKKAAELAKQMWDMMRQAASWADDEITLAKMYGVDVEDLQRMQHAAKLVDVDVDTMIKARQKLAQAMGKELQSKDMKKAFQDLRVPVYDQNGKMRDLENVFWDAGAALMNMDNAVEQNNTAMKIFGKSWLELKPLFMAGRKEYEGAMAEATVVPQENIEKLGSLQDQLDRLDDQFQTLKMNILGELAPAFETLATVLTDLMNEFNEYLQTDEGKAMMESLREAVQSFFSELKNVDLTTAVDAVKGGLNSIKTALDWIRENKEKIVPAIEAIGIAFAGLKLANLALNIGKIVSGLNFMRQVKNLPTGDSGGTGTGTGGGDTVAPAPLIKNAGVKVAVTKGATTMAEVFSQAGLLPAVTADMFLNQTNAGRGLRDGGGISGLIEGAKEDIHEMVEDVKTNVEEFPDNWNPHSENANILAKSWLQNGENTYRFWKGVWDDSMKGLEDLQRKIFGGGEGGEAKTEGVTVEAEKVEMVVPDEAKINPLTMKLMGEDMIKNGTLLPQGTLNDGVNSTLYQPPAGSDEGRNGAKLTQRDLDNFNKLPGEMSKEVGRAVGGIKVQMDRYVVGELVAPVVSQIIARDSA